jgi:hypothetical protein
MHEVLSLHNEKGANNGTVRLRKSEFAFFTVTTALAALFELRKKTKRRRQKDDERQRFLIQYTRRG